MTNRAQSASQSSNNMCAPSMQCANLNCTELRMTDFGITEEGAKNMTIVINEYNSLIIVRTKMS